MKKDKKKIIGEELDDQRLKDLLTLKPPAGENRAFHILIRAYRSLRAKDFERFAQFYKAQGFPINPKNQKGEAFITIIKQHRYAEPYIQALENTG